MADEDAPPAPEPEPAPPEQPPEAPQQPPEEPASPPPPPTSPKDAFSLEFLYYGSILKVVAPTLTSDDDKKLVTPWIKKLFRPEYQTSKLREKRNRYLGALTVNILNDELTGVFHHAPTEEPLVDLSTIEAEPSVAAEWETDSMWHETLTMLPEDFQLMACCIHSEKADCKLDHKLDKVLDQEFQFLLYLTRPYAAMINPDDRARVASWLQTLCTIHGDSCSSMKAIRNDYLSCLLGYLHDLRAVGPFSEFPPERLEPLDRAAKAWAKTNPTIDPVGPEMDHFLSEQPVPEDGAFCYIALTGDLIASSL